MPLHGAARAGCGSAHRARHTWHHTSGSHAPPRQHRGQHRCCQHQWPPCPAPGWPQDTTAVLPGTRHYSQVCACPATHSPGLSPAPQGPRAHQPLAGRRVLGLAAHPGARAALVAACARHWGRGCQSQLSHRHPRCLSLSRVGGWAQEALPLLSLLCSPAAAVNQPPSCVSGTRRADSHCQLPHP